MQLTVRETAKLLSVSEKTVYRWASAGEIPVYVVNGQYRFNKAELLEWATARNRPIDTALFRVGEEVASTPGVSQCLEAGGIFYSLLGAGKESALRSMVEKVKLPERIDREMLYQILLARERLGTTAIGKGIAIPHVRHPIVLSVASPMLSLWFLERPIEFGAADKEPVHTLFFLVAPTVGAHMHLLSQLASLLRDAGFLSAIERRAIPEEILREARRAENSTSTASRRDKE